jgi:Ca2+-binding RTX toxin-like protein
VLGGNGADSIMGDNFANLLDGGAGHDTLDGSTDNDTLRGGAGNDSLIGGSGSADWVSYGDATDGVSVSLQDNRATGGGLGNDSLIGFEAVLGGSGNDTLVGSNGNDTIAGGFGNNSLLGGGTSNADWLIYADFSGSVTVDLVANSASHASGNDTLSGFEVVLGGSGDDRGYGVATDPQGVAYVVGATSSSDFNVQFPLASYGGGTDTFVAKLISNAAISVAPAALEVQVGKVASLSLTLNTPAATPTIIALSSSNPAVARVPASWKLLSVPPVTAMLARPKSAAGSLSWNVSAAVPPTKSSPDPVLLTVTVGATVSIVNARLAAVLA